MEPFLMTTGAVTAAVGLVGVAALVLLGVGAGATLLAVPWVVGERFDDVIAVAVVVGAAVGLAACAALKCGMAQLSAERVSKEVLKLLAAPDPRAAVRAMAKRSTCSRSRRPPSS